MVSIWSVFYYELPSCTALEPPGGPVSGGASVHTLGSGLDDFGQVDLSILTESFYQDACMCTHGMHAAHPFGLEPYGQELPPTLYRMHAYTHI